MTRVTHCVNTAVTLHMRSNVLKPSCYSNSPPDLVLQNSAYGDLDLLLKISCYEVMFSNKRIETASAYLFIS